MKRKKSKFLKRLGTFALTSMVALSPIMGVIPPLTVQAAHTTDAPYVSASSYGVTPGHLRIGMVDAGIYGTHVASRINSTDATLDKTAAWSYWKDTNLTLTDFAYTPEGMSTFDMNLQLGVYKLEGSNIGAKVGVVNYNTSAGYFDIDFTMTSHNAGGFKDLVDTATTSGIDSNYVIIQENEAPTGVKQTHTASTHGWYLIFTTTADGKVNLWKSTSFGYGSTLVDVKANGYTTMFADDGSGHMHLVNGAVATDEKTVKPLDNQPLCAGFSFKLDDKDLGDPGKSQGDANLNDAVFVVFNVSEQNNRGVADNKGYSTSGYVIVDHDNDGDFKNGTLDHDEDRIPIPAYSLTEIKDAYEAYVSGYVAAANKDTYYNTHVRDGYFNLNTNEGKDARVAAMIIKDSDDGAVDGKFSTKTGYLPVGNYLVLQVKAGEGYYLDEDFKPVINIGAFSALGTDVGGSTTNAQVNAGANYVGTGYNKFMDNSYASIYTPVYLNAAGNNGNIYNIDLATVTKNVTHSGITSNNVSEAYTSTVALANSDRKQSDGQFDATTGSRLKPVVGQSKLRCHDTIIRGAEALLLADSVDVLPANKATSGKHQNIHSNVYDQEPQGDGNLNIAQYKITNNSTNPVVVAGKTIAAGSSEIIAGAAALDTQYPGIATTIDMFPYGRYTIEQVEFGVGYEADTVDPGLSAMPVTMKVTTEDKLGMYKDAAWTPTNTIVPIQNGASTSVKNYFTNDLINGGEIYTVVTTSGESTAAVTLQVYNISDHYVWVDKDGNGTIENTERFETIQSVYDNQIKGKSGFTMKTIKDVLTLAGAVPCKEVTITPDTPYDHDETLPYGRYMVVVSAIPDGYTLVSEPVIVDTTVDGDHSSKDVKATIRIERTDAAATITTTHLEASNMIDSVKVENEVSLYDSVNVANLTGNTQYRMYGVVVNKTTGKLIPGQIATGTFTSTSGGTKATVTNLITTAPDAADQAAMATWFANVKAADLSKELNSAAESGIFNITDASRRAQYRTTILGYLNTMKDKGGATGALALYFPSRNMWPHEGETYVCYEYLMPYSVAPATGYNTAKTLEEFETAINAGTALAVHKDINDEDQTVYVPTLDVTAKASLSGGKVIDPTETVVGTIPVGNLEPGNTYKVVVELHDEAGSVIECGGKTQFETTFVADSTTKTLTQTFTGLDAKKYNKQRLTVYATLYRVVGGKDYQLILKGDPDSVGYDPTVDPETPGPNQVDVLCPTVVTRLTGKNNAKTVDFSDEEEKVTLTDTVTYSNLIVGGNYKSVLSLVNSDGTVLLDDKGVELKAEVTFTATETSKVIEIPIEFIATRAAGQKVIAFNDLYRTNGAVTRVVAEEHDVNSEDQTVTAKTTSKKPTVTTVAIDSASRTHTLSAQGGSIVDTVTGAYLEPNTEYLLITEIAVNGAVFDRVEPIQTKVETDDEGAFKTKVTIGGLSADALAGKTIVVFETLMNKANTKVIVEHKDVDDKNQTIYVGTMTTTAVSESGEKTIKCGKDIIIVDQVHYTGLTAGNTYTLVTTANLNVGGSGGAIGIPVKTQFTPTASSGDITVKITVDTSEYAGKDITIFEEIIDDYSSTVMISHKDINDAAQTVKVEGGDDDDPKDPKDPKDPSNPSNPGDPGKPQTGVDQFYGLYLALASLLIFGSVFGSVMFFKKRKKVESDK